MSTATRKTVCPVSRDEFKAAAKAVAVTINGAPIVAAIKQFSTNSMGWYANDKVNVQVGDEVLKCQLGFTLTVIGSKDLPIAA